MLRTLITHVHLMATPAHLPAFPWGVRKTPDSGQCRSSLECFCVSWLWLQVQDTSTHSLRLCFQGSSPHCSQNLPGCNKGCELRLEVGEGTEHFRQAASSHCGPELQLNCIPAAWPRFMDLASRASTTLVYSWALIYSL